jgi:outer membrane protein TolC
MPSVDDRPSAFPDLVTRLADRSPALEELREAYRALADVASTDTPWPNPTLEVGPEWGSGFPSGTDDHTRPFFAIGFAVPLGGRLGAQDDLNAARAARARIGVHGRHRELYLALRRHYAALVLASRRLALQEELVKATRELVEAGKTLMQAGAVSSLDVNIWQVNASMLELERLDLEEKVLSAERELSLLLGMDAAAFQNLRSGDLPPLKADIPARKALLLVLVENNVELGTLRVDYEVAERELQLEVAKQFPDLTIGFEREQDLVEDTVEFGLPLGIELPIFDRNQQSIARAAGNRKRVRAAYTAAVHRALTNLDHARAVLAQAETRRVLLEETILPQSETNLKAARQSLQVGGIDAVTYLEVLRANQELVRESAMVEQQIRDAWIALETVLGRPLIQYPGEETFDLPLIPQEMKPSLEADDE